MGKYVAWVFGAKAVLDLHSKNLRRRMSNSQNGSFSPLASGPELRLCLAMWQLAYSPSRASALLLYVPALRLTLNAFNPLEAILAQLGATFGTILA